jgi:hypothetical protein
MEVTNEKYDIARIVSSEVNRIQNHQKFQMNLESKFKSDLKKFQSEISKRKTRL